MFVYILFSEQRSRYYVGQTADIDNRLKRHNQGKVPSTKYGVPWKLVLQIVVSNKTEALVLERRIKKRGAKRYIDDHLGVHHAYSVAGLARPVKPQALLSRCVWDAEVVTPMA